MLNQDEFNRYKDVIKSLEVEFHELSDVLVAAAGKISHIKKLNPYDLLTELDVAVEDRITEHLSKLDPSIAVVGEERGGDRSAARYWLIDPIDGTIHFVRGNPFYCIMLALIVDKIPVVSIIYNFATRELFYAVKGYGAYRNGEPLQASDRPLREAIVQTEINLHTEHNLKLQQKLSKEFRLLSLFCPGYEYSMIASGKAEARICIDPFGKDYDFAPGALLVQEAGGVAKNLSGEDFKTTDRNFIVASSESVYRGLIDCVNN